MTKIQYNIRLKEGLLNDLKEIADSRNKKTSEIVEKVLTEYVQMQTVKKEAPTSGVPVEDEDGNIIALVSYNNNLDYWNGSNWTSGSTGRHKGLTQLENGEYVLIFGTDWQGEKDHAIIIDPERAVDEILKSENLELFQRFPNLTKIANGKLMKEK